jgi:hypothetical protein
VLVCVYVWVFVCVCVFVYYNPVYNLPPSVYNPLPYAYDMHTGVQSIELFGAQHFTGLAPLLPLAALAPALSLETNKLIGKLEALGMDLAHYRQGATMRFFSPPAACFPSGPPLKGYYRNRPPSRRFVDFGPGAVGAGAGGEMRNTTKVCGRYVGRIEAPWGEHRLFEGVGDADVWQERALGMCDIAHTADAPNPDTGRELSIVIYQRDRTRRFSDLGGVLRAVQSRQREGGGGNGGNTSLWRHTVLVHSDHSEPCALMHQIAQCDLLLTPHGFQSMLLMYLRPGGTLMEIFPYKYLTSCFAVLTPVMRLHYAMAENSALTQTGTGTTGAGTGTGTGLDNRFDNTSAIGTVREVREYDSDSGWRLLAGGAGLPPDSQYAAFEKRYLQEVARIRGLERESVGRHLKHLREAKLSDTDLLEMSHDACIKHHNCRLYARGKDVDLPPSHIKLLIDTMSSIESRAGRQV